MKERVCKFHNANSCVKIEELDLLLKITAMLGGKSVDLNAVIKVLATHLNVYRLYLTLLNRNSQDISINDGYGLSEDELKNGVYKIGEGIIGQVVKSGEVFTIPDVAKSTAFLNRTKALIDDPIIRTSFICIPVKYKEDVVGTISFHKATECVDDIFDEEVRLLKIVAGMIGQTLRRRQEYAEEMEILKQENYRLRTDLKNFTTQPESIKGKSGKMSEVFSLINSVAPTDATVIIRGESGVGKELVADAIHNASTRRDMSFIKVNCAALPDSLIESELFGHEKGAFTGATQRRIGRFEAANGGTIFLDELGDIPHSTQIKLLRVLQAREFERLGGTQTIKVDVRILCATNRDLERMIGEGDFREDLYYRINVFPIYIPALRERINDIPILVDHFIDKFNRQYNKGIKRITSMAIEALMMYNWPGNIRELENCMERACILSQESVIRVNCLPPTLQTAATSGTVAQGSLEVIMGNLEKQVIIDALVASRGNIAKAASSLTITERIMGLRIAKYAIDPKRYKSLRD
ncbi:MAG: sigma 54-interacting transcriptional regulator [Rikenellaceae bacterium]